MTQPGRSCSETSGAPDSVSTGAPTGGSALSRAEHTFDSGDVIYVAIAPCGCIHGFDFGNDEETAKQLGEWIMRGSTIERRSASEAVRFQQCTHTPKWGRS